VLLLLFVDVDSADSADIAGAGVLVQVDDDDQKTEAVFFGGANAMHKGSERNAHGKRRSDFILWWGTSIATPSYWPM